MYKYKITIFTPTYNRGHLLERLYNSIKRQTFKNFEWIIVDDGSYDNTEEIVSAWLKEDNYFPIRYYKKTNGGKCRAINYAVDLAEGQLFFTVDSDDYLTDDALEKIDFWENTIKDKKMFCGVAGMKGTSDEFLKNANTNFSYLDMNSLDQDFNKVGNATCERAEAIYTEIYRKFKSPEYEGENFISEGVVWNRIAHLGYDFRCFSDIIWIFEYLDTGLTKNIHKLHLQNPYGYGLLLKEKLLFTKTSFKEKFQTYYFFYCDMVEQYDYKQIASFIKTKKIFMKIIEIIHKIKSKLK